jgi:hypothetical protein
MPGLPHPLLQDGVNVSKSVGRSRLAIWFQDAAELAIYDMSLANYISVGDWNYRKDNTLVGSIGTDVLLDGNGNRWRRLTGDVYLMPFSMTLGYGANELLLVHAFTGNVTFPTNLAGSSGIALNSATAERRFRIFKNNAVSPFAEVILAAANPVPTFSGAETVFTRGDYARVLAPTELDATLQNVGITLLGSR